MEDLIENNIVQEKSPEKLLQADFDAANKEAESINKEISKKEKVPLVSKQEEDDLNRNDFNYWKKRLPTG